MRLEESKAYIDVLLCIAKADGIISESELKYIKAIAPYKGISVEEVENMAVVINNDNPQLDTILQQIGDEAGKELLKSILVLGYADGDYSEPEKRAYTYISGYFELRMKDVQEIEKEAIEINDPKIEDDSFRVSLNEFDNVIDDKAQIIARKWIWNLDDNDGTTIFGCSIDELIAAWNK